MFEKWERTEWEWAETEQQVKRMSWKRKSADEVLEACLAKWEHIRYRLTRKSNLDFDDYSTSTCPACAKWMIRSFTKECSKCPLRSMVAEEANSGCCCAGLWNTFSNVRSLENVDAILAFIAGRKYLVAKRRLK